MSTQLTTTSYAILGLLGIRSWTTYELAQQMERSLRNFWPRAASRIYEEPKRLVRLGLAAAASEPVGRRRRTIYSITQSGRAALDAWLAEPGSGPVLEFEALLKVFFAEQGRREDVLANIRSVRAWAQDQNRTNVAFARLYRDSGGPFPERLPAIALTGVFLTELTDAVERWARWAEGVAASWPDDLRAAEPPWDVLREIAERDVPSKVLPPSEGFPDP